MDYKDDEQWHLWNREAKRRILGLKVHEDDTNPKKNIRPSQAVGYYLTPNKNNSTPVSGGVYTTTNRITPVLQPINNVVLEIQGITQEIIPIDTDLDEVDDKNWDDHNWDDIIEREEEHTQREGEVRLLDAT